MLQAAVAVARDHGHKHIAVCAVEKGRAPGARLEQGDLGFANGLHVPGDALEIQPGDLAGEHQFVQGAVRGEADDLRRAHLHRIVDQRVVVRRPIQAETVSPRRALHAAGFGQRGVDLPVFQPGRGDEIEQAGFVFLPLDAQEHAGAVEESMRLVQVRAAHGQVPGIDGVFDFERAGARRGLPGMVVEFFHAHRPPAAPGGQCLDLARKIANQVAAGYPGGQGEFLALGVWPRHGERDAVAVSGGVVGLQTIENGAIVHASYFNSDRQETYP